MKIRTAARIAGALVVSVLATGCATQASYDYSAFQRNRPASILILPPVNDSTSAKASYGMMSQMTLPLAESGYYVMPVTLVDETFRQNGLSNPAEIESVPVAKLREIFGADAALYVRVKTYGTSYAVISSVTTVTADGRLIDLRTGDKLWEGTATANDGGGASANAGLIGMLVQALVNQIVASTTDKSHDIAGLTSVNLLMAGRPGGMLFGPRSPKYQSE